MGGEILYKNVTMPTFQTVWWRLFIEAETLSVLLLRLQTVMCRFLVSPVLELDREDTDDQCEDHATEEDYCHPVVAETKTQNQDPKKSTHCHNCKFFVARGR